MVIGAFMFSAVLIGKKTPVPWILVDEQSYATVPLPLMNSIRNIFDRSVLGRGSFHRLIGVVCCVLVVGGWWLAVYLLLYVLNGRNF